MVGFGGVQMENSAASVEVIQNTIDAGYRSIEAVVPGRWGDEATKKPFSGLWSSFRPITWISTQFTSHTEIIMGHGEPCRNCVSLGKSKPLACITYLWY